MIGNGKYEFSTYNAAPVVVPVVVAAVFVVVVAVVLPSPNTAVLPVEVPDPRVTVPVQVAPKGQQAIFFAWSVVQTEPCVQQAAASFLFRVEQELKFVGQLPSLLRRSWFSIGEVSL